MNSRRSFLKKIMAVGVLSATCPHKMLAIIEPEKIKDTGKNILGTYKFDILQKDKSGNLKYPDLQNLWGSVFLDPIVGMDGSFQYLELNHIDENEFGKPYAVMNRSCPHMGEMVELLNPELKVIRCPRHGSLFKADGSLYYSETTTLSLEMYPCTYDGDHTLYFELPFYVSAEDSGAINPDLAIERTFPNPCRGNLLVDFYSGNDGEIDATVYDTIGNKVSRLGTSFVRRGKNELHADLSSLASGFYFLKLSTKDGRSATSKFYIVK